MTAPVTVGRRQLANDAWEALLSAHASLMVRARVTAWVPSDPSGSGLKQTTSQRPTLVRVRPMPRCAMSSRPRGGSDAAGAVSVASVSAGPKAGERFSNTATS